MAWSPAQLSNRYTSYDITVRYSYSSGKGVVPVSRNSDKTANPVQIVDLQSPMCRMIVAWSAGRVGVKPVLPSPVPTDPNLVLLSAEVEPLNAILDSSGNQHRFEVSGVYVYQCLEPVWVVEENPDTPEVDSGGTLSGGAPPVDDSSPSATAFYGSDFAGGILPI